MIHAAASSIDAAWRELQRVSPVKLEAIRTEQQYRQMVSFMNELLDEVGDEEGHSMMGLLDIVSGFIDEYEKRNVKLPEADPAAALRFLMEQHGLRQVDLAELFGSQSNVSEVLSGKREINARQARELAKQFGVTSAAFI